MRVKKGMIFAIVTLKIVMKILRKRKILNSLPSAYGDRELTYGRSSIALIFFAESTSLPFVWSKEINFRPIKVLPVLNAFC